MHHRFASLILLSSLPLTTPSQSAAQTPYLILNTSSFQLAYTERDRDRVGIVLDMLDRSYHDISQALDFSPSEPLRVILHANRDYSPPTNSPNSFAYYSLGDRTIHILYGWTSTSSTADSRTQNTLTHEMTHAFVNAMTPAPVPRWFNEGLAVYFQTRPDQAVTVAGITRDLRAGVLPSLENSPYQAGFAAIYYIVQRYGMTSVRDILLESRRRPFPTAFRAILGTDISTIDRQFRDALR